jgi:ABC-type amino acid transport substrate-binding protein
MKMISRRQFLTVAGVVSAAGVLSACGAASSAASSAAASSAAASSAAGSAASAAVTADTDPYTFLTDKKIGVQLGTTGDLYISGDISDSKLGKASVEEYNKGADAVQALLSGKIDAVVIDDQVAQKFVDNNKGLAILPTEYITEDYAVCFAKGSELTAKFNTAIASCKSDGTLDAVLAKYIDGDTTAAGYVSSKTSYANGTLHMATNAAFEPYEYYEGDKIVGIDAELAKAICDALDYDLVIDDMEFDSIIVAVTQGKADFGMAGMTVTDERKQSVDFSDTYCTGVQVIVYKQ